MLGAQGVREGQRFLATDGVAPAGLERDAAVHTLGPRQGDEGTATFMDSGVRCLPRFGFAEVIEDAADDLGGVQLRQRSAPGRRVWDNLL